MLFCYEFVIFLKTKGFIRLTIASRTEELPLRDNVNKITLLWINLYYMAFVVAGMAYAYQWRLFIALFAVGIVSSILAHYFKSDKEVIKKIDSVICMVLLAMIFINHYH